MSELEKKNNNRRDHVIENFLTKIGCRKNNLILFCLLWELNPRSPHYECDALPLGQAGIENFNKI